MRYSTTAVRALLVAAALVSFGASLGSSFHFDDYAILSDPAWHPLQTRPLTNLTFWLNYQVGGNNPAGYHAVNLALHCAVVLLLFEALRRLIPRNAAVVAAAIFAVHPIVAEPVIYVFARGTLLNTLFCMSALLCWLMERRWLAVSCFGAALLAKEECVTFPVVVLLLAVSMRRGRQARWPVAAMLLMSAVAGARVLLATAAVRGAGLSAGISPLQYLFAQGVVIPRYFRLLLIPWGFTVDPDIRVPPAWLGVLGWTAIFCLAALALRRFRDVREGFWLIAGLVLLLPSSSIFPVADLAADRRMYLPLIAFAPAAGLAMQNWKPAAAAGIALVLMVLSFQRTQVWMSEKSLWTEAVERAPAKIRPRIQLARALDPGPALAQLQEAARLAPGDALVATETGKLLLSTGRPAEALAQFGRALALNPNDARALSNRGAALAELRQTDAARADFERALERDPCSFDARFNLKSLGMSAPPPAVRCLWTDEQRRLLNIPPR